MNRRPLNMWSDEELGAAVSSLAPSLWPATPPLAESVTSRLRAAPARTHGAPRSGIWAAAAMIAALVVGPFFFSSTLREAAADFFGVPGVEIEVTDKAPEARRSPPDLGMRSDLAAAIAEVPFAVRVPRALGAPDEVFLDRSRGETVVSLVYEPRRELPETAETGVGLLIMEFEGRVSGNLIKKVAAQGSTLELVDVNGVAGYWISGAPHPILYRDPEGVVRESTARLAANTLLFSTGGVTFRIEGDVELRVALEVARSL